MPSSGLRFPSGKLILLSAILIYSSPSPAQTSGATPQAAAVTHTALSPERISELGHRLLAAGARSNGLAGGDLKPWHMKVEFEMLPDSRASKPVSGILEEWYLDRDHWRRTYDSSEPTWRGSEWRAGKAHRYVTHRRLNDFEEYWLTSRVANPVINPLYQVDNVRPADQLLVERISSNNLTLNCASLAHPEEQHGRMPEWIVPTMCFDSDLHVRLMRSESIAGQFYDLQPFQGRAVARDVKLISGDRVYCEMKVTVLETVDKVDEALLTPDADAIERPYVLESSDPQPVAIYQVGASIPLVGGMPPYRGSLAFPVVIRKDGSVKVEGGVGGGPMQYIWDAIDNAVSRWKYKPYVVDGGPVEVEFRVIYNVDGKPFVPQVERQ